jgi:hypothetical protein
MQTSGAKQNFRSDDPAWVLLVELSLRDFLSDHDWRNGRTAGFLFQTVQELGMSPEYIENIAGTLADFAKEAFVRTKQGRLESPEWIRIFCQKRIIDDANSAKNSRTYPIEQDKKQKQIFPDSRAKTIGGWGYFIIERGEDLRSDPSAISKSYIDLYLYKEGN